MDKLPAFVFSKVQGLSQTTQQNAAGAEEIAGTAQSMGAQARALQETMGFFKIADGRSKANDPTRTSAGATKSTRRTKPALKVAAEAEPPAGGMDESDFKKFA